MKLSSTECLQILGDPEDVRLEEYVQYTYIPFEFFFRNSITKEDNDQRTLTSITVDKPRQLINIFNIGKSIRTIHPIEVLDFLDHHEIKHDSDRSSMLGYIYPPPVIKTQRGTNFYFGASDKGDLFLESISQDVFDSSYSKGIYIVTIYATTRDTDDSLHHLKDKRIFDTQFSRTVSFKISGPQSFIKNKIDTIATEFLGAGANEILSWTISPLEQAPENDSQ